jgi:DNA-directed RNA polymerase subunit RPC12/RpoP
MFSGLMVYNYIEGISMPIFEYLCPRCGRVESISANFKKHIPCPECGLKAKIVPSIAHGFVRYKETLPLGNKSRGRFIPPKGNKMGILIPSFGYLEKEEVDYITEAAIEKEEKRVKNLVRKSGKKKAVENATKYLMSKPKEERMKILKEIGGKHG